MKRAILQNWEWKDQVPENYKPPRLKILLCEQCGRPFITKKLPSSRIRRYCSVECAPPKNRKRVKILDCSIKQVPIPPMVPDWTSLDIFHDRIVVASLMRYILCWGRMPGKKTREKKYGFSETHRRCFGS